MKLKDLVEKYGNLEVDNRLEEELKGYVKSRLWKPGIGDRYYYYDQPFGASDSFWDNDTLDNARRNSFNCFRTQTEAEFEFEKQKVYNELRMFALENNDEIVWDDDTTNWCICYDSSERKIDIDSHIIFQDIGQIYFSNRKLAERAIEKVGENRIKKYLFGVS